MERRFGGSRGYGWRKDPENHGMPAFHVLAQKFSVSAIPNSVDYRAQVLAGPGIMDQGQVGSCVGHATDGSIETRLMIAGTPIAHRSPVWVYDAARCIERARNYPNTPLDNLPALEDVGSYPSDAWQGVTEWGMAPYAERPTSNSTANDEPKLGLVESASDLILTGAYRIDSTGSSRVRAVQTALANGFPVAIAVLVDYAFEEWDGVNPLGAPDPNRLLGGHYIYVTSYQVLSTGKVIFGGPNSWSYLWGDEGFWLGDENFLAGADDLYAADVRVTV